MIPFNPRCTIDPFISDNVHLVTASYPVYQPYPYYPHCPDYFANCSQDQSITSIYMQEQEYLQYQMRATIKNLQFFFSVDNVLTDLQIQSMMSRSLWVPLEQVLELWLYYLGINFEQLQEYAIWKMYRLDTNFELDTTRTLIRPTWAKASRIKFRVNHSVKVSDRKRFATAKRVLRKALESVVATQQIAHENKMVESTFLGQEADRSFASSFNAPGIPSLILPFVNGYSECGVKVKVIEIMDSILIPREYPALKLDDSKQSRNGKVLPLQ